MYTHRYICICDRTISNRQYIETQPFLGRHRKVQMTDRGHCSLEWQPVTTAGHYTKYERQIAVTAHWSDSLWQQLAITQSTNDRSQSLLTGVTACDRSWPLHKVQITDCGHYSLEWQPVTAAGHYTRYKWQIAVTAHWSDSLWQKLAVTQHVRQPLNLH